MNCYLISVEITGTHVQYMYFTLHNVILAVDGEALTLGKCFLSRYNLLFFIFSLHFVNTFYYVLSVKFRQHCNKHYSGTFNTVKNSAWNMNNTSQVSLSFFWLYGWTSRPKKSIYLSLSVRVFETFELKMKIIILHGLGTQQKP